MGAQFISWILGHFGLSMFILACVIACFSQLKNKNQFSTAEIWFRWLILLPAGITGLYAFMMHAFFGDFTAATIGWSNSPFQYEVAIANLGFGLLSILAFRASYSFRLAAVTGLSVWLWGDAVGHIYQMLTAHNFTPGNVGSWFVLDVVLPIALIVLVTHLKKQRS